MDDLNLARDRQQFLGLGCGDVWNIRIRTKNAVYVHNREFRRTAAASSLENAETALQCVVQICLKRSVVVKRDDSQRVSLKVSRPIFFQ